MAIHTVLRDKRLAAYVILGLLCYSVLSVYQLTLPGLEYDEVFFGPAALGLTRDFSSSPLPSDSQFTSRVSPLAFNTFSLPVGPSFLPVMLMPYWGALKVYLMVPVFSFWEVSPQTIRMPAVFVGLLTLLVLYLFLARLFSPVVGLIATLFLASDPSYIFYTRHDFGAAALSLLLVCCPLWCLVRWVESNEIHWWAAAFFLFGVGVYGRLDYCAFLAALGVTTLIYGWRELHRRVGKREIALACFFFIVGASPLLFFIWKRPALASLPFAIATPMQDLSTVVRVKGYVLWTVLNGTSLYDFFSDRSAINLGKEIGTDGEVQVGSYTVEKQSLLISSLFTGTFTPYLVLCFVVVLCFCHPPPTLKALVVFLLSLALCVLAVRGAIRGHHFVIFLPFIQVFLAASLVYLWQQIRTPLVRMSLVIAGVACVVTNVLMDLRYHSLFATTGGKGVWSEAVYELARYTQEYCRKEQRCFIGDWGMGTQLATLNEGKSTVEEFFWPYVQAGDERLLETLVRETNARFVFYADPYVNFSRPKRLFYAAAWKMNYEVVVECVFSERDGTPVIEVVRVEEKT